MKKIKLSFFVDTSRKSGGAFYEMDYISKSIIEKNKKRFDLSFICTNEDLTNELKKKNLQVNFFKLNRLQRLINYLIVQNSFFRRLFSIKLIKNLFRVLFIYNYFEKFIEKNRIDLVIFTDPSQYTLYLNNFNFIVTVPDISHLENTEFSEWVNHGEFQRKEELLSYSLRRSLKVITNADIIKNQLSKSYAILPEKIHIINQQPSTYIKYFENEPNKWDFVKKKFELPKKYLFYPAMYLAHKNHKLIIETVKFLNNKKNFDISAVFCGADKGYLDKIKNFSKDLNINEKIKFLPFVEDEYLPYIYISSFALVMPTFSGPTNIPPWEAFRLNVPVFYSNLKDIDKVYKDSVYYIDPHDYKTLANGVIKLNNNALLRKNLIEKGNNLLKNNNFEIEIESLLKEIQKLGVKI